MSHNHELSLSWMRVGGVCGILSIVSYLIAAFVPLPDTLSYAAAFAFGPLLAVGAIGLYHCLAIKRRSPAAQIATLFAIAAGITVLIMLSTQQAIFGVMKLAIERAGESTSAEVYREVEEGLNAVHQGMDVAWDVLISVAVILFGIEMVRHPKFGKVMGGLGIVLGSLLLVFNLWYFPVPPASAHSIDWGPFVALWMLAAFVLLLLAVKWAGENVERELAASYGQSKR
ncbi:MAG TPA: hypothetical protein VLR90_06835 [Blastocatellia bacterium]|nr:hypothetical protein [Blastocatellia bacterium]